MAAAGVDGVTITGVLGESNRLTDAERETLIRTAVGALPAGFPVVVGTSHPGTQATRALSQMAQELGAAGVMVTPSKEGVPVNDAKMVEYFSKVADGVPGLPIVLQDHPASTQVHMSVPLLVQLTLEIPQVACVKLEATPTPARIALFRKLLEPHRRDVSVLTGLGALYGMFELQAGGNGFMTGFAFPEVLKAMVTAHDNGDKGAAWAIYQRFLPLMVFEQQPGVAVRKELYKLRGLFQSGHVRHPGGEISPYASETLAAIIKGTLPNMDVTKPLPPDLGLSEYSGCASA